jgi:glycosyltransferase 2 family protein
MVRKIWSALKYYVFLGVGVFLVYYVFRDVNLPSLWEQMKTAQFSWLALSFVCGVLAMLSRAKRWMILLEPMGYKPGLMNSFNAVSLGYFANIGVPRMGEIVRCTVLNQTNRIPVTELIGTVLLERVIDVIILLSLILVVILSQISRFGSFFMKEVFGDKIDKVSYLIDVTGWWLLLIVPFTVILVTLTTRWLFGRYGHITPLKKVKQFGDGIRNGFVSLFKLKQRGAFLFHTFFIWFNYFIMTWVCLYAYEPTAGLGAFDGLFLMVVGGLGMTAPVPGGIGAFHILVSNALVLYGINPVIDPVSLKEIFSPGLVFATLVHTTQFIMTVCCGLFSLLVLTIYRKRVHA